MFCCREKNEWWRGFCNFLITELHQEKVDQLASEVRPVILPHPPSVSSFSIYVFPVISAVPIYDNSCQSEHLVISSASKSVPVPNPCLPNSTTHCLILLILPSSIQFISKRQGGRKRERGKERGKIRNWRRIEQEEKEGGGRGSAEVEKKRWMQPLFLPTVSNKAWVNRKYSCALSLSLWLSVFFTLSFGSCTPLHSLSKNTLHSYST